MVTRITLAALSVCVAVYVLIMSQWLLPGKIAAAVLVGLAFWAIRNGFVRAATEVPIGPFARDLPSPLLLKESAVCLWDGVTLGYLTSTRPLRFLGRDTSVLIAGEPGSGKTVFLNNLISALALDPNCEFSLFDGKGSIEFCRWEGIAQHIDRSGDAGPLLAYLTTVFKEIQRRKEVLKEMDEVKLTRDIYQADMPLMYVVIDELAAYTSTYPNKKLGQGVVQMLGKIAAQGRFVGVLLVLSTQHPSVEVIPSIVRNNIQMRVVFRVATPTASNIVLGQGMAKHGYDASQIMMVAERGVGFAHFEGRWPRKFKSCRLEYKHTKPIAERALAIRSGGPTRHLPLVPASPDDDALPSRSLADDIRYVWRDAERLHNSVILQRLQALDRKYYGPWSPQLFGRRLRDVGLAKYKMQWTEADRVNHWGLPASALKEALEPDDGVTPSERRREREALAMEALDEIGLLAYQARIAEIEQSTRCEYCDFQYTADSGPTVDHWIPLAKGGTNDPSNLRSCCGVCNSSKRDRDGVSWLRERNRVA